MPFNLILPLTPPSNISIALIATLHFTLALSLPLTLTLTLPLTPTLTLTQTYMKVDAISHLSLNILYQPYPNRNSTHSFNSNRNRNPNLCKGRCHLALVTEDPISALQNMKEGKRPTTDRANVIGIVTLEDVIEEILQGKPYSISLTLTLMQP
jgi:hypothetical protein